MYHLHFVNSDVQKISITMKKKTMFAMNCRILKGKLKVESATAFIHYTRNSGILNRNTQK